ncbi:MAG: thiamine-phosphate kinase [Cyanobacteria bacterium]|nr:thiamine-phosphate kinase [Cyanobacteriota bacterium]MDA0865572.1 thiamine-phosphate kinase [Cyanobacteriota bacterium]
MALIQRLQPFCAVDLIGDDAAVLPANAADWVVTTDVLVDGVHFSDRTTPPESVGWRAVAANLSDLAAMGASPVGITVGLSLPGTVPVTWVEAVYRGMATCLQTYGGAILGGDVVRSAQVSLAITALGRVTPGQAFYRHGAQPGDVIVVTGYHGASRAGLELLLNPAAGAALSPSVRGAWIEAHQRPRPRFDVVEVLRQILNAYPTASMGAMDSSDGLANAILHLCKASGVGARLVRSQLPFPPALVGWVGMAAAERWVLYGGEDFELVLCLPREIAQALVNQLGPTAAIVGTIQPDPGVYLVETPDVTTGISLGWEDCFQHF